MEEKVRLVLVASGNGTDANSIMAAWRNGFLPEVEIAGLISTKYKAKCLEKAENHKVERFVADYFFDSKVQLNKFERLNHFNLKVSEILRALKTDLVFLVGCNHKIFRENKIPMYNIHPADPIAHGGDKMYGLDVHRHVLREMRDQLARGMKTINGRFFTYPTVHEASGKYDQGKELIRGDVEIPRDLIEKFMDKKITLGKAAKKLQEHVLPYEWLMLPFAVKMAAKKILDERR